MPPGCPGHLLGAPWFDAVQVRTTKTLGAPWWLLGYLKMLPDDSKCSYLSDGATWVHMKSNPVKPSRRHPSGASGGLLLVFLAALDVS